MTAMAPTLKTNEGARTIHAETENFSMTNRRSGSPRGLLLALRCTSIRFCSVVYALGAKIASSNQSETPKCGRRKIVATINIEIAPATYVRDPIVACGKLSEPSGGVIISGVFLRRRFFHRVHYNHAKIPML